MHICKDLCVTLRQTCTDTVVNEYFTHRELLWHVCVLICFCEEVASIFVFVQGKQQKTKRLSSLPIAKGRRDTICVFFTLPFKSGVVFYFFSYSSLFCQLLLLLFITCSSVMHCGQKYSYKIHSLLYKFHLCRTSVDSMILYYFTLWLIKVLNWYRAKILKQVNIHK